MLTVFVKVLTLCLMFVSVSFVHASEQITPFDPDKGIEFCTYEHSGMEWDSVEFIRYVPSTYQKNPDKKYPLVLFLHGSPPKAHTLDDLRTSGIFDHVQEKQDFIVIAPRSPFRKGWPVKVLTSLLDKTISMLRVDQERIYVTGYSMGGFASWKMAFEYPERFAALAPVCGGGEPENLWRIASIPVWAFHGGADPTVPMYRSEEMIDTLNKIGGEGILTIYPGVGHDSWTQTYKRDDLYEWLLSQKRTPQKKTAFAKLYCELKSAITVNSETQYRSDRIFSEINHVLRLQNSSADQSGTFSATVQAPEGVVAEPASINVELESGQIKDISIRLKNLQPSQPDNLKQVGLKWKTTWHPEGIKGWEYESKETALVIAQVYPCPQANVEVDSVKWECFPYSIPMDNGSAHFATGHDNEFLYVGVLVEDSEPVFDVNKNPWDQDDVEIRVDARPDPERALGLRYGEFRTVFLAAISPNFSDLSSPLIYNEDLLPEGTGIKVSKVPGGYFVEVAVPVEYLDKMQKKPWEMLRINVKVTDTDADGKARHCWWKPDWRHSSDTPASGTFVKVK